MLPRRNPVFYNLKPLQTFYRRYGHCNVNHVIAQVGLNHLAGPIDALQ